MTDMIKVTKPSANKNAASLKDDASKEATTRVNFEAPATLKTQFKMKALERGEKMNEALTRLMREYVSN